MKNPTDLIPQKRYELTGHIIIGAAGSCSTAYRKMATNIVDATSSLSSKGIDFDFDGVDLSKWTTHQLKLFLKPREARLTGRRNDLLAL